MYGYCVVVLYATSFPYHLSPPALSSELVLVDTLRGPVSRRHEAMPLTLPPFLVVALGAFRGVALEVCLTVTAPVVASPR